MSYGTYDNQSPLNQPFNPTASTGIGNDFGKVVGNVVADKLFGQNAQGPLSGLTRGLPGMIMNSVVAPAADRLTSGKNLQGIGQGVFNSNLPGAPSPEAQQKVQQSQQGGGILKLRQPQPMFNGGKSGGGKYATPMINDPMPSQPVERPQYMPIPGDLPGTVTGPDMAMPTPEIIPSPMPAVQPIQQLGGKSGGGMQFGGGKSGGNSGGNMMVDPNMYQRGDLGAPSFQVQTHELKPDVLPFGGQ